MGFMRDHFTLAYKNLRRRGIRSWLTLIGIFIGIAAVVSLISLGNSLKDTVNAQFNIGSAEVISVEAGGISGYGPPGTAVSNPITKKDADAIERISYVEAAIPLYIETIRLEYNDFATISNAQSVSEERIDYFYENLDLEAASGRLLNKNDFNNVMIGSELYPKEKNGFEKDILVGNKITINGEDFVVIGILQKKGSFIIDGAIYMMEDKLVDLNNLTENVDLISVKVKNKELIDRAKEEIEKLLRERRDVKIGEEDFQVSTPESSLASVNQILSGIQVFIVLVASISIFVGAIGIANTMTTSVVERKKEIGIMKAIGARNMDIFYQFFIEAGLLGLIGGIIGIILGIGLSYLGTASLNSFLGTETQPNINSYLIVFSLLGSFFVGAVSGIIPALNAARQNPVESLR